MKKILFTFFTLLLIAIPQFSIPNGDLLAQTVKKYSILQYTYQQPDCYVDPKGQYTYDECQAKLHEGKYIFYPGANGSPFSCLKSDKGTLTYDECQAKGTEGKYIVFGPDAITRQYTCLKSDKGTLTYDQCQNAIRNNSNPGSGLAGKNPCATPDPQDPTRNIVIECPTALGNIPADPAGFISRILQIAIGLAGGIALIFMVIGSIKVLTSSGDQQKLTGGKDMIVAAVSGLLFLILSVLILRFIGTSLLERVPGL